MNNSKQNKQSKLLIKSADVDIKDGGVAGKREDVAARENECWLVIGYILIHQSHNTSTNMADKHDRSLPPMTLVKTLTLLAHVKRICRVYLTFDARYS